jgi:hypothetical protein
MGKLMKYDSYEAGFHDCQISLMDKSELRPNVDFTPPNEDVGELDQLEYLRGQVAALIKYHRKDNPKSNLYIKGIQ